MTTFLTDRARWNELLNHVDRTKAGKINNQQHSIESLTRRLTLHEQIHLSTRPESQKNNAQRPVVKKGSSDG